LDSGQPIVVTVDARVEDDNLRLNAQRVELLDQVTAHAAAGLRVILGERSALPELKSAVAPGGRGRVTIVVPLESREVEIEPPGGCRIGPSTRAAVRDLAGVLEVQDV